MELNYISLIESSLKDIRVENIDNLIIKNLKEEYANTLSKDKTKFIERVNFRHTLFKSGKLLEEIEKEVSERYKISHTMNDLNLELRKTYIYIVYKLGCDLYNLNIINKIKNDIKLLERIYIRLTLIINGWNDITIEKRIAKKYKLYYDKYKWYASYFYIRKIIQNSIKINQLKKGRPKLPKELLCIYNKIHNNECLKSIKQKYKIYNIIKSFTQEDITYIKNSLKKESDINNTIINKLNELETLI